ncbi:MAG: hypothetical protein ACH349_02580 [Candidatus Rhabdochlamydia sp.]|jgi:hypothetical protein|nr:hypothetical protein [Chlamydiota bacterium]
MDENITPSESSDSSKFIVDPLNGSERSINYGLYSKAFSYTKHYNILKIRYKIALLGWVLATFVAFSYVLSGKEVGAPIDRMISIALVAIFASRGVLLIMVLDAEIYHRLLNASFSANLEMETKGISKSRIHKNMMKLLVPEATLKSCKEYEKSLTPFALKFKKFICWIFTGEKGKGLDPVFYDGLFYCGSCFCLWVVAGISISTYFYYHYYRIAAIACGILTPIISFLICIHLIKRVLKSGISKFKKGKNE